MRYLDDTRVKITFQDIAQFTDHINSVEKDTSNELRKRHGSTYSSTSGRCSKICQDNVVNMGFLDRFLRKRTRK